MSNLVTMNDDQYCFNKSKFLTIIISTLMTGTGRR